MDTLPEQAPARSARLARSVRILALIIVLLLALITAGIIAFVKGDYLGVSTESRNSQVVQSLDRDEEIVLLGLGVQGIAEERVARTVFGQTVPGSGRTLFLQYTFRAKLGIEGDDVIIEPKGDDTILITVPEFIFIGHEDITFKTVLEDNGVLSWVTPDIDTPDVINDILTDETMQEHVDANRDILEDQTEMFYTSIIATVDPAIRVVFDFLGSSTS